MAETVETYRGVGGSCRIQHLMADRALRMEWPDDFISD